MNFALRGGLLAQYVDGLHVIKFDFLSKLQEVSPDATPEQLSTMTFAQLRDELLAAGDGPLDRTWIGRVNAAEAEFWRRNSGCARRIR